MIVVIIIWIPIIFFWLLDFNVWTKVSGLFLRSLSSFNQILLLSLLLLLSLFIEFLIGLEYTNLLFFPNSNDLLDNLIVINIIWYKYLLMLTVMNYNYYNIFHSYKNYNYL